MKIRNVRGIIFKCASCKSEYEISAQKSEIEKNTSII